LWRDVYGLGLGPLVPLTMHRDDVAIDANGILSLLEKNQTVQLCGGSGCGKSHLLMHLTMRLPDLGFAPVFLRAADFAGDLDWLLNRAVSTVAPLSFDQLVRGCRTRSRDPVVILDAINECPSSLRTLLFAALQKLRTQFDFPVILSNQSQLLLPSSLGGPIIKISPPSRAEKRALYPSYGTGETLRIVTEALPLYLTECAAKADDWASVISEFEGADQVPLMTIHKSKGLEYDTVLFVGLDDRMWWSHTSGDYEGQATFFVGLSRAKQRAIFTYCKARGTRQAVSDLYELLSVAGAGAVLRVICFGGDAGSLFLAVMDAPSGRGSRSG
jgi:hypothetical protein